MREFVKRKGQSLADGPHSSSNGAATHTVGARGRNGASQDTKGKENKMEEEAVTANDVFQKRDV